MQKICIKMYTYPLFVRQNDENSEMQGDFMDFPLHSFCITFIIGFTKKGIPFFVPQGAAGHPPPASRPQIFMEMNEK